MIKFNKNQQLKINNSKLNRGFTLVELLLYVGVSSSLLLVSSLFLSTLLESRIKNQTIAEVDQQGLAVMQQITQNIRNAKKINLPLPGTSSQSLSIDIVTSENNLVVFDSLGGAVQIREGLGPIIPLTNSRVVVSNLLFVNLSRASTTDTVRVQFKLASVNKTGRNEYSFERDFISSATVR